METKRNLQTSQTIAKLFGVSTRRIEQLKTEGVIHGEGKPTKYDLLPTIKSYIKFLSDKANGREKKETDEKSSSRKLKAEADYREAKAKIEKLKLKELEGRLHAAEDVEAVITDHALYIRSMLLAMPGKLAVDVAEISSPAEAAERIKKEVHYILNCAADYRYNPEEFAKRVREREGWRDTSEDEDD